MDWLEEKESVDTVDRVLAALNKELSLAYGRPMEILDTPERELLCWGMGGNIKADSIEPSPPRPRPKPIPGKFQFGVIDVDEDEEKDEKKESGDNSDSGKETEEKQDGAEEEKEEDHAEDESGGTSADEGAEATVRRGDGEEGEGTPSPLGEGGL